MFMRHFIPRLSALLLIAVSAFGADQTTGVKVQGGDITTTGTFTGAAQTVSLSLNGQSTAVVTVDGGSLTWVVDGCTATSCGNLPLYEPAQVTDSVSSVTGLGAKRVNAAGFASLRVRVTAYTSGTGNVTVRASTGIRPDFATAVTSAPSGTELGLITRNIPSGTQTVSGSVTISGSVNVKDGAGNSLVSSTTTPVGTEQALIVRNVPSGTQTVTCSSGCSSASDTTNTAAISSGGSGVAVSSLNGVGVVAVEIRGTYTGVSLTAAGQVAGLSSSSLDFYDSNGVSQGTTLSLGATHDVTYFMRASGFQIVSVTVSAIASGTVNLYLRASTAAGPIGKSTINGTVPVSIAATVNTNDVSSSATGSAVSASAIQIGGTDGTNLRGIKTDTNGYIQTARVDGSRTTYSAAAASFASASTATDICTITGSGTKTVRVTQAWLAGTQTTAGTIQVFLEKRSTADTSGTAVAATVVPLDSSNASGTATVNAYTGNPTTGSLVGHVRSNKLFIPAPATAAGEPIWLMDFGTRPSQAIVLRGTAQVLAFNLNSTTVSGSAMTCGFEWTEE
jgi:hypothetical protein